jgi:hypothetical protein
MAQISAAISYIGCIVPCKNKTTTTTNNNNTGNKQETINTLCCYCCCYYNIPHCRIVSFSTVIKSRIGKNTAIVNHTILFTCEQETIVVCSFGYTPHHWPSSTHNASSLFVIVDQGYAPTDHWGWVKRWLMSKQQQKQKRQAFPLCARLIAGPLLQQQ